MVQGNPIEVGQRLVRHPQLAAVGFTGSLRGGRALFDAAAQRPHPIPVYAEMGSVNPIVITSRALAARGEAIAQGRSGTAGDGVAEGLGHGDSPCWSPVTTRSRQDVFGGSRWRVQLSCGGRHQRHRVAAPQSRLL